MARILLLVALLATVTAENLTVTADNLTVQADNLTGQADNLTVQLPEKSKVRPNPHINRAKCDSAFERLRNNLIDQSQCGPPKEVFEYLNVRGLHLQLSPHAVWVKKCVGLCDYDSYGTKCVPLEKQIRLIPLRIYNVRTNKDNCATYAVEDHVSCGCCGTGQQCAAPRVLDPPTATLRPQAPKQQPARETLPSRPRPSAADYHRYGSQKVDCRKDL